MSKEAAMRAMREARYNERAAASTTGTTAARSATRPAVRAEKTEAARPDAPPASSDGLCGHRSMNGRTCTREQGHAAKSHRYS
ncbi:hypothetical protein [Nocardioides pocheonensis]|uniref:hypothetical protein n=1 Tax=Nocardioides pocheonensis TaxID=661485 RepID=UPI0011CEB0DE|nr:hypothetical protein [Nocardioides pocheonensis]